MNAPLSGSQKVEEQPRNDPEYPVFERLVALIISETAVRPVISFLGEILGVVAIAGKSVGEAEDLLVSLLHQFAERSAVSYDRCDVSTCHEVISLEFLPVTTGTRPDEFQFP
ncbi:MAG: hypothetical protein CNCCGFBP_00829 [Fimbriimonadaceae bacterium]|nr:hypothetical protein [Fimbriimonadaceae bacterium]